MSSEKASTISLGHTDVSLRSDSIVEVIASDHIYSKEDLKSIHRAIADVTHHNKSLLLLVSSKFTSIEAEARHYLSTPEAAAHSIAEAYIIKSLAQRLLLNFMIKVQGTPVPVRFFTEKGPALLWLKSFVPGAGEV